MIINLHLTLSKMTPSSFCTKDPRKQGTHTAAKNHSKLIKLIAGTWSLAGQVPCQFKSYCFYSYILNTFLYDKNLSWALSFLLNMIYEILNTINTKTLVPSLLIWSRAGPGSIIESKSPRRKHIMLRPTSLICLK